MTFFPEKLGLESRLHEAVGYLHPSILLGGGPKVVYHYTDAAGLYGILGSGSLYMTSDDEAKDPLELRYANALFRQAWQDEVGQGQLLLGLTETDLNPYTPVADLTAPYGTYTTAFCERPDEPHHWQNFAAGGRGFALGIALGPWNAENWTTTAGQKTKLWYGRVAYDEHEQLGMLRTVLRTLAQEGAGSDAFKYGARQVFGELIPFFKHESFATEREWRLVATRLGGHTPSGAKILVDGTTLRAVMEAKPTSGALPLEEVWVGPRIDPRVKKHIEALAHTKNLEPDIRVSRWRA